MCSTTWSRCARPITAEPTQLEGDAARQRRDAAACARRRDRSALPGRSRARPLLRPAGRGRNPDPMVEAVVRLAQRVNVRSTPSSGRRLNLYGLGLNAQAAVESVSDRTGGDAHAASVARNLRLRICSRAPPHLGLFLCTDGEEPGRHPHNADKHHAVPAVTVRIHPLCPSRRNRRAPAHRRKQQPRPERNDAAKPFLLVAAGYNASLVRFSLYSPRKNPFPASRQTTPELG